jgi:hypothetical protein
METPGLSLLLLAVLLDDGLAKKMLPIYMEEAEAYSISVESAPKTPLELKKEPVFEWSNRNGDGSITQGVLFLWLRDGRPAALGTIFSAPEIALGGRTLVHEFHALDPEKLLIARPKEFLNKWEPKSGLDRKVLDDASTPAAARRARLVQMRSLALEFGGYEIGQEGERWELRLLPTPLYRYAEAKAGVIDGALFAFVSNAGTDPEVLLLVEVIEEADGTMQWEYAIGRFSDRNLYVHRNAKEFWSMVLGGDNTFVHDPLHRYHACPEKIVSLEGKVIARLKQTPDGHEVIKVDGK